ncbi:MAG: polysaccharide deacetylase family protein [Flavobacteriales bacterium]|nr:polysaccharide deacetylase family protein [Flavobacteriales bacterium]
MLTHRNLLFVLVPIHVVLLGIALFDRMPWWPFFVVLFAHLGLITWGSLDLGLGFFLKAHRIGKPGTLALTYDDGPHPEHTPALLDLLKREGVEAAFFCIGRHVEAHPQLVERMVREGHLVGSHSQDHPMGWGFLPTAQVVEQILRGRASVQAASGMQTSFFRPPFGVTSPNVARAVKTTKVQVIGWDVRPFDTTFRTTKKRLAWIFGDQPKGTIVVLHDTVGPVVETTQAIIDRCRAQKVPLLRVDRSLNLSA